MAEKPAARSDLTVPPTDVEVKTFEKVMDMLNAYRKTHLIMAALKLGVFSALHGSKLSAEEVGRRCKAHESRKLDSMLDLLCVEDLLVREKGENGTMVYGNAEGAEKLLSDPSSPTHVGFFDLMFVEGDEEMRKWQNLADNLRAAPGEEKGLEPASHEHPDCHAEESKDDWGSNPEEVQKSGEMYQMFESFMRINLNLLAKHIDFSKYKRVLDIGGGTAQLSRILCREYKHLECINMDLARVQPSAEARMKEVGADVADRITLLAGNCLKDDLPAPVDVVVIANVLHGFETTESQALALKKSFDALSPGGSLVVVEDFIDLGSKFDNGMYWKLSGQFSSPGHDHGHDHGHGEMPDSFTTESFTEVCKGAGFNTVNFCQLTTGMMTVAVAVKS